MDFFKEFSKQFSNVARSVTEKSKERENAELTRLNGAVREANDGLEALYARYGKACYAVQEGRGNRAETEALAVRIRAGLLQLEELTARRDALRQLKRCANCGAAFPKEARFCSACGKRLPEEAPRPEPVEEGEYCPACGARREGDEPRCPVCGAAFDAPAPAPKEPAVPESGDTRPDVEEPEGYGE